ncbi:MAG: class I SAM-dependent methyltransferase [Chlamydiia bacterium]|nr:class I SAM-dependent methyltransferase [Chlamydiia bacterium]
MSDPAEEIFLKGMQLENEGSWPLAADLYYRALLADPQQEYLWAHFAYAIRFLEFPVSDPALVKTLEICFTKRRSINPQHLAVPVFSLVRMSSDWLSHSLFLPLLRSCIVPYQEFEQYVTELRRSLLMGELSNTELADAIAEHCALNEYVYVETEEETARLREEKNPRLRAMYRAKKEDPLLAIPLLRALTDPVTIKVAQQYEENPYPRWTGITRRQPRDFYVYLKSLFPESEISKRDGAFQLLVAGSGTGQHALSSALFYKDCHVLALDISKRALSYAKEKAEELGVENVSFLQGDILDLFLLEQQFDAIECVGVLHHMDNPEEGLAQLVKTLKPGGLLNLGLYSERGRRDVVAARRFVEEQEYQPTLEGIRRCRQALFALSEEHPAKPVTYSVDFFSASCCRDLIFHAMEHRLTLEQVAALLEKYELQFLGFDLFDKETLHKYRQRYPDDPDALSLTNWSFFEEQYPETFMGMYQFWARAR